MNGAAFTGLNQLNEVDLESNICIDEKFSYDTRITNLKKIVTAKCGLFATIEMIKILQNSIEKLRLENLNLEGRIAKLESANKPKDSR